MRIFKPTFKDRSSGEQRETQKLYLDFQDHKRIRRRLPAPGCRTEQQAQRFGAMLEALVTARQYGDSLDRKLADWLHGLPKGTLRKFVEIDLIGSEYTAATISLDRHVADFEKWLKETKARHGFSRSPTYIHNTLTQIRYIIVECGFRSWGDVTRGAVETCLGKLDVASKTFNAYQASFKLFGDWMVANGRSLISPVKGIKAVRWTKTETRRALTQEEVRILLQTTPAQPVYYGMSGVQRSVLYLLALETGYRLNELRCLTVGCFDLEDAVVNLDARYTKSHMEANQLLKRGRVERYRTFLADQEPREPVFAMPGDNEVLDVFRRDLGAAGIKPVDDRGVKVVFHSLRYCLATALDRTGATLKERMTILRHSDKGNLSLGVYTTIQVLDLRGAIERLPDYPWPTVSEQQREEMVA
jgi:integrase